VAAGVALASGVTGLAATGTIGRVQREYPFAFSVAIGFAVAAAAFWTFSATTAAKRQEPQPPAKRLIKFWKWTSKPWLWLGIAAAASAVILGFVLSIQTAGKSERPTVTFAIDPATLVVSGTVKADHLRSHDPLNLWIDGLNVVATGYKATRLSELSIGPDADGNVSHQIAVRLPPGRFDAVGVEATIKNSQPDECGSYPTQVHTQLASAARAATIAPSGEAAASPEPTKASPGTGCAILPLPPVRSRPRMTWSWSGAVLKLDVDATNVANGTSGDRLLRVDVIGRNDRGRREMLYRSVDEPEGQGTFKRSLQVPVQAHIIRICAVARMVSQDTSRRLSHCPLRGVGLSTAFELRGPGKRRPLRQ
jgi:hypothetical protein